MGGSLFTNVLKKFFTFKFKFENKVPTERSHPLFVAKQRTPT